MKLHNAIITYNLSHGILDSTPPPMSNQDEAFIGVHGGVEMQSTPDNPLSPQGLLGGGHHRSGLEAVENRVETGELPREVLYRQVVNLGLQCPD